MWLTIWTIKQLKTFPALLWHLCARDSTGSPLEFPCVKMEFGKWPYSKLTVHWSLLAYKHFTSFQALYISLSNGKRFDRR
jgi:hypothetical protein